MFRKTLTAFSFTGLVLSLGLWVVSYWHVGAKCPKPLVMVQLSRGAVIIAEWGPSIEVEPIGEYSISCRGFDGFSTRWRPRCSLQREDSLIGTIFWGIVIPLWIPTLGCGLSFFSLYCRGRKRARRVRRGLCFQCGYDLRGSSARCPECGTDFSQH